MEAAVRADLCDRLAAAGLKRIEAASFVNPKLVPAMAGAEDVMAALHRRQGTSYAGLVLNQVGYDRAIAAGVDEIHYAFAATDEFCRRNQNATTEQGLETALALAPKATGNIATEDLVYLLRGMGVETGIDLDALIECSRWLGRQLGKELPSMVSRAGDFPTAG